jgi:hypothetical protein
MCKKVDKFAGILMGLCLILAALTSPLALWWNIILYFLGALNIFVSCLDVKKDSVYFLKFEIGRKSKFKFKLGSKVHNYERDKDVIFTAQEISKGIYRVSWDDGLRSVTYSKEAVDGCVKRGSWIKI